MEVELDLRPFGPRLMVLQGLVYLVEVWPEDEHYGNVLGIRHLLFSEHHDLLAADHELQYSKQRILGNDAV